jgi:hypothetical protein
MEIPKNMLNLIINMAKPVNSTRVEAAAAAAKDIATALTSNSTFEQLRLFVTKHQVGFTICSVVLVFLVVALLVACICRRRIFFHLCVRRRRVIHRQDPLVGELFIREKTHFLIFKYKQIFFINRRIRERPR